MRIYTGCNGKFVGYMVLQISKLVTHKVILHVAYRDK